MIFVCELSEFIWKDVEVHLSSWHYAAFGGFYRDHLESDINVCNVNNVNSDHGDIIIIKYTVCATSLLIYEEDDPLVAATFR